MVARFFTIQYLSTIFFVDIQGRHQIIILENEADFSLQKLVNLCLAGKYILAINREASVCWTIKFTGFHLQLHAI